MMIWCATNNIFIHHAYKPSIELVYSGTGHRPDKLGGYSDESRSLLTAYLVTILRSHRPTKIITGMAIGYDTALALAAHELGIPFIAAVPFKGQERMWPQASKDLYYKVLSLAAEVVIVSEGSYHPSKMQIRNEWMVDRADAVLALWNGTPGGTCNCVKYAERKKKLVLNIWPGWEELIAA